jgi:uncharacterized protein YbcI
VLEDCVVVLMRGTRAVHEHALAAAGHTELVEQMRSTIHRSARHAYTQAIERQLGRRVIGFLTDGQIDPDIECHVYVLEPRSRETFERASNGNAAEDR